jgi:hypothetical protein
MDHKLTDAVLAPALDKLARIDGEPVDYGFIDVRHLGAIYEELLEYRLVIDDAARGEVHLETDKGERKATGSYYTPEYIVKYIIKHTLEPILASRAERFKELMRQISQVRQQLGDGRRNSGSTGILRKDLQRLERQAWETLLDIKVCDPAMGSGHFLVTAVDFITTELIRILSEYPEDNPVLEQLAKIREDIIANLEKQGISIHPSKLRDDNLLHRAVMKRCIYGVDLNPMAVELAKLSLWLHSFTVGAPLSFLDHHLRCGNSLIGATAREAESSMAVDAGGQLTLFSGPFVGLLRAAEIMRGISVLSDATFGEVETSERLFRDFDRQAKPYKQLLDIYVSRHFGVRGADSFLRRYGALAINANPERMSEADAAVVREARRLYEEKRFFHWDLEFPEVFIDLQTASWKENPEFDAVVGNPPYVRQEGLGADKPFLKEQYLAYHGVADLYVYFVERGLISLQQRGQFGFIVSNKFMRANYGGSLRQLLTTRSHLRQIIDFGELPVFPEAATFPSILLFEKGSPASGQNVTVAKIKTINFKDLEAEVKDFAYRVNESSLAAEGWSLAEGRLIDVLGKITQVSVSLGNYVSGRMYRGILTGLNEAFFIDRTTRDSLIAAAPASRELIRPLVVGDDVRRYEIKDRDCYLIAVPAGWTRSQCASTDEETAWAWFSSAYPALAHHLYPFAETASKRWDKGEFWWELRACDYYHAFGQPKIIYPEIAREARFTWDDRGYYANNKCFIISSTDLYLLALLNSHLVFEVTKLRVSVLGDESAGGRLELRTVHLQHLPIRRIDFTTPPEERTGYLEIAKSICEDYLTEGEGTAILELVRKHLSHGRTDVIHDLLAYLAGGMIELNKQKQAEMKDFLVWLSREIGIGTESLTNKTRVQNYLGDYQKDESTLSFEELLEILKKNRKRLSADVSARGFQERLQREYQASLDKLLPVKGRLAGTDSLIDGIVCRLYGLTDEEIATVGGR